jgi:mannose/fructose/N-acetylgalactosamine-specific phosphotransferase system component IIC
MFRKFAAFGGCFTVMLLLAAAMPGAALAAGPVPADAGAPAIHVTVWQAALIAIGYYLANSPWLFGLAYFTLYRPLVAGFLVGVILGHPAEGTLIGAAINVPFLGFLSAGGSLPIDPGFAGWVGVTLALAGHLDPATAVSIAMGLGLLGTLIFYGRMAVDSIFAHWADQRAEKADLTGVALMNWLPGQAFLLVVSFVPVFLFALNGPAYVQDILDRLPLWIVNGLVIAGGVLPAIGIAMNMRFIFRGSVIPYFFLGFILMTVTHGSISLVVIAAIGLALAFLHLNFVRRDAPAATGTAAAKAGAARAVADKARWM